MICITDLRLGKGGPSSHIRVFGGTNMIIEKLIEHKKLEAVPREVMISCNGKGKGKCKSFN